MPVQAEYSSDARVAVRFSFVAHFRKPGESIGGVGHPNPYNSHGRRYLGNFA